MPKINLRLNGGNDFIVAGLDLDTCICCFISRQISIQQNSLYVRIPIFHIQGIKCRKVCDALYQPMPKICLQEMICQNFSNPQSGLNNLMPVRQSDPDQEHRPSATQATLE